MNVSVRGCKLSSIKVMLYSHPEFWGLLCFHAMRPSKKKNVIFFFWGGGSIFHYWIWTRVDRKVTLWSLNLIHKFNPNYLLINPRQTICFHAMRPSKYQNNNTESLMGVQTSYMLLDWTILLFNFQENWQTLVFTMFQVWKGNVHNTQQN